MTRILIAEDEPRIVRFLDNGLTAASYTTHATDNGNSALDLALCGEFDLMLLDLGLPGRDGFAVLTELRARRSPLPVVVLTARAGPDDIVAGLDGGADDYLTKPFRLAELLARIRLRMRDEHVRETFILRHGDLSLDLRSRQASISACSRSSSSMCSTSRCTAAERSVLSACWRCAICRASVGARSQSSSSAKSCSSAASWMTGAS